MKNYLLILFAFSSVLFTYAGSTPVDTTKAKIKPVDFSKNCDKIDAVYILIGQAIEVGAPTYNEGNHIGCYMIYEGTAYKILNKYGSRCSEVSNILEGALEKSQGNYSATDKAWIMRMAFDKILGEPTKTK